MKLTEFGKFSRKLRIDNGELLKDMAIKLNVTVSYLSAVEIGKRNIPEKWEEEIVRAYHLNLQEREELKEAIIYSKKVFKINVENFEKEEKDFTQKALRADYVAGLAVCYNDKMHNKAKLQLLTICDTMKGHKHE